MHCALLSCLLLLPCLAAAQGLPANYVAGSLIQLNDNGGWSWFMDDRAIVHEGKLIVGSVRAIGDFRNSADSNWGNVEISAYDLATGATKKTILHKHFEQDDHDGPALLPLPDGRYLAAYSKHGAERVFYFRHSAPHDPLTWGPAIEFTTPGASDRPFRGNNVTSANLFPLPSGRILNFYRGVGFTPNYMYSDDSGRTWTYGGRILKGRGGYSPYLKYAYDGKSTIHFIATDDHPRNFDNSIYAGYVRDGGIFFTDGTPRGKLTTDTTVQLAAWDMMPVFKGDPDNVGWVMDLKLDAQQRPYGLFSVQKDGRGLPRGQGGFDHRFDYARWDGKAWHVHEIAYAGTRLYAGEDDYTGLGALDPNDPDVAYISTDAEPATGKPLVSTADGKRHHELFRGRTRDSGTTWTWEPITANSTVDNLRPIVPRWKDARTALVWMRGTYESNHGKWSTAVVAVVLGGKG
ncbi:MAG: hypothetical protein NVS1B4_20450 [Gemmatimonadaceae bacterium]